MGAVVLCTFLYTILVFQRNKGAWIVVTHGFSVWIVSGCFLLGWLIYGSVILFGMKTYEDCQYSAYMSAYIVTVISELTLLNN